jgi:hypothetical protein
MMYNRFKEIMYYCKKFIEKMNQENIPRETQKILLKAYLTGFNININEYNLNLLLLSRY